MFCPGCERALDCASSPGKALMGDALYCAVRAFARLWIWIFFRRILVRHLERVPLRGPVLLAMNHPNNLIDALIIGAIIRRKIHYLATAALFENPFLAAFLGAMGVIQIHRRQDTAEPTERNAAAFEACYQALDAGAVIGKARRMPNRGCSASGPEPPGSCSRPRRDTADGSASVSFLSGSRSPLGSPSGARSS